MYLKLYQYNLKGRGNELEVGTAILFDLLGFTSIPLSQLQNDAPDILVFPEKGDWLIIVECTSREPDLNNKLTKLATRTKEIVRHIEGFSVYPVLVTSMERAMFNETDLEKARKENISIMSAENLSYLMGLASEGTSTVEVKNYLKELVPIEKSTSLLPR